MEVGIIIGTEAEKIINFFGKNVRHLDSCAVEEGKSYCNCGLVRKFEILVRDVREYGTLRQ